MLDEFGGGRPGDQRGFIHKKILGGVSKLTGIASSFLPGPLAGIARTVSGITGSFSGRTVPRTQTARVTQFSQAEKNLGRSLKFPDLPSRGPRAFGGPSLAPRIGPGAQPCPPGMRPDFKSGQCEAAAGQEVGEAIMGRYGAGLLPGEIIIERAVCLKGMQLGNDGVCYNKSQISNKQRMWPAGRKPLLTGGDMRAIAIASRAGKRMDQATTRLRKLGMMKKPPVAKKAPAPTQHERLIEAHVTK